MKLPDHSLPKVLFSLLLVELATLFFISHSPGKVYSAENHVVINEIAWSGTAASSSDEWIELYNPTASDVNLDGWVLKSTDDVPSASLSGTIAAGGYYLIERTDDTTVNNVTADLIYSGALEDAGESLELRNASDEVVDTANADGDVWPGGDSTTKASMERVDPTAPDTDNNWGTNDGVTVNGQDANGFCSVNSPIRMIRRGVYSINL